MQETHIEVTDLRTERKIIVYNIKKRTNRSTTNFTGMAVNPTEL